MLLQVDKCNMLVTLSIKYNSRISPLFWMLFGMISNYVKIQHQYYWYKAIKFT